MNDMSPAKAAFDFDTPIDRRGAGSSKWSRYPADVLPMWVADMDFAVAPQIIEAIESRLRHPVLGYGVAREALRDRIVAHAQAAYDWTINAQDIVFLPGVVAGFNMALRAMLKPGDGVCVQTPVYRPILAAPAHWDMKRIDVELKLGGDGRYASDPAEMEAALRRSKALVLCNPHNPLGKVFTRKELGHLAETCLASDVLIVSDEIHCDILFDGARHVPIASLSPEIARRSVTLMSASKTYNVAGLKVAFAIIPDKDIREKFDNTRFGLVDSCNVLGLEATLAAYTHGESWRRALLDYLQANRDWLLDAIPRMLPGVRMTKPDSTFLAWLDCAALGLQGGAQQFFLEKARVGFNPGDEFGASAGRFVRLNFGCPRSSLEEGLKRMSRALDAQ